MGEEEPDTKAKAVQAVNGLYNDYLERRRNLNGANPRYDDKLNEIAAQLWERLLPVAKGLCGPRLDVSEANGKFALLLSLPDGEVKNFHNLFLSAVMRKHIDITTRKHDNLNEPLPDSKCLRDRVDDRPEDYAMAREAAGRIRRAIHTALEGKDLLTVNTAILHLQGMGAEEIASTLHSKQTAVHMSISRFRRRVFEAYTQQRGVAADDGEKLFHEDREAMSGHGIALSDLIDPEEARANAKVAKGGGASGYKRG